MPHDWRRPRLEGVPEAHAPPSACQPSFLRYAEWPHQVRPANLADVFFRELHFAPRTAWISAGLFWIALVAIVIAENVFADTDGAIAFVCFVGVIVMMASIPVSLVSVANMNRYRDKSQVETLESLREGDPWEQVPVVIQVFTGGTCIASDHGLASITEGFLYFSGLGTSFSFSPQAATLLPRARPGLGFEFVRFGRRYRLRVKGLRAGTAADTFRTARSLWVKQVRGPGRIEVLPPTSIAQKAYSDAISSWTRRWFLPLAIPGMPALMMLGVFFAGQLGSPDRVFTIIAITMLIPWLLAFGYLGLKVWRLRWISKRLENLARS